MNDYLVFGSKRLSVLTVALASLVFSAPSRAAVIVPSSILVGGGAAVGVPLTSASAGTLLATLDAPFSFSTTAGTTSGDILSAVFQNPSGTLDFYYQVRNSANSVTSLARESDTSFFSFFTAVAFRLDGSTLGAGFVNGTPGLIPVTADRDPSGTVVGFNFTPAPLGTRIPPGTTSAVLVISTDATLFRAGNAEVIDGGTQTVAAFEPFANTSQVPDQGSTCILLGISLLGLFLTKQPIGRRV